MGDSLFGTAGDPANRQDPEWLEDPWAGAPTTDQPAADAAEGPPAGPARDERGRFTAAPEAGPEPATDETQATSTPDPEAIQATPEEFAQLQAAQAAQQSGAEEVTEEPVGETPAEEAQRLYANKYSTVEDLELGYRSSTDMVRRMMEARQAEESERIRAENERAQYEQALRSAIPMIEQAARDRQALIAYARQYQQENGVLPPGLDPSIFSAPAQGSPDMLDRASVERMLTERLNAERAAMAEQAQQAAEFEALRRTVTEFYQAHPEVTPEGDLDRGITANAAELAYSPAWMNYVNPDGSVGAVVDLTDRNSVEVMYEAVKRPALLEILKIRPDYFTTEAGLRIARRDAALLEGVPATTEPKTATVTSSRAGTRAGVRVPYVEDASGSVPQQSAPNPNDPWEQVKADDRADRGGRAKPIFLE